jgi:hypothetical protein
MSGKRLPPILLVADLFQPIDILAFSANVSRQAESRISPIYVKSSDRTCSVDTLY